MVISVDDLTEYKQSFIACAQLIPNYKELTAQEAADQYVECKSEEDRNSYISLLILKYWKKINVYYYRSLSLHIDKLDVLNWIFDSMLCSLNQHVWTDEKNKLHGDKNAFDKVLNRCLACSRYTDYQAANRKKRKLGHDNKSLDQLKEDYNDSFLDIDS